MLSTDVHKPYSFYKLKELYYCIKNEYFKNKSKQDAIYLNF